MNENAVLKELLSVYRRTSTTPGASLPVDEPVAPTTIGSPTPPPISLIEHQGSQKTSKIPDAPVFTDGKTPTFDA